eukprot:PhF_6_TR26233/c2_g2_i3/m.37441
MPRSKASNRGHTQECYHCGAQGEHSPESCPEYLETLQVQATTKDSETRKAAVNKFQSVPPVKYIPDAEYSTNWKDRPKILSVTKALEVLEDIVSKFPWPNELYFNPKSFPDYESKMFARDIVWFANVFREEMWKRRDNELHAKSQGAVLHRQGHRSSADECSIGMYLTYLDAVKPLNAFLKHEQLSTPTSYAVWAMLFDSTKVLGFVLDKPFRLRALRHLVSKVSSFGLDDSFPIDVTAATEGTSLKSCLVPRVIDGSLLHLALRKLIPHLNLLLIDPTNDLARARSIARLIPIEALRRHASSVLTPYRADVATFLWVECGGVLNMDTITNSFWKTQKRYHELSMGTSLSDIGVMPKNHLQAGMLRMIPAWGPNAYPNVHRPLIEVEGDNVTKYFYDMKVPAPFEVTPGGPAYVENKEEFLLNLEAYSGIQRHEFPNLKKYGFVVSGGAVVASLLPLFPIGTSIDERRRFYREHFPTADVDMFCTSTGLRHNRNRRNCENAYLTFLEFVCNSLLGGAPALVVCTSRLVNIIRGGDHPVIQLPLGDWVSTAEVAFFADIDCTGVVFDGEDVFFSSRSYYAWSTRTNCVCRDRVLYGVRGSPVYENRLFKYRTRGFIPVDVGATAAESEANLARYKESDGSEPSEKKEDDHEGHGEKIVRQAQGNVLLKLMEEELHNAGCVSSTLKAHGAFIDLEFSEGIDVKTASLQDLADSFAKAELTSSHTEYGPMLRDHEVVLTEYCKSVVTYHPVDLFRMEEEEVYDYRKQKTVKKEKKVPMNGYQHTSMAEFKYYLACCLIRHERCESRLAENQSWD